MKNLYYFGGSYFKNKMLAFEIFDESNIWANAYHICKIEV